MKYFKSDYKCLTDKIYIIQIYVNIKYHIVTDVVKILNNKKYYVNKAVIVKGYLGK